MNSLWNKLVSYSRNYFSSGDSVRPVNQYDSNAGRLVRARTFWGFYNDSVYSAVHTYANELKKAYDLPANVRSISNPAARISDFWGQRVWFGDTIETSFPIKEDSKYRGLKEDIRTVLSTSNFLSIKTAIALQGSTLGDIFLWVRYNPGLKIHQIVNVPSYNVSEVIVNQYGTITEYTLLIPNISDLESVFEHGFIKDGTAFIEYLNDKGVKIAEPKALSNGKLPLFFGKHVDAGNVFGHSEYKKKLTTFTELDLLSTKLSDYVDKVFNAPWLFTGMRKPKRGTSEEVDIVVGKGTTPALFAREPTAKPQPLIANLDIQSALNLMSMHIEDLTNVFPELRLAPGFDRSSGDLSGRAIRTTRQEATDKVITIRPNYDKAMYDAIVYVLKADFNNKYTSVKPVEVLFDVSGREVFELGIAEKLELEKAIYVNIGLSQRVGAPIELVLTRMGLSKEEIKSFIDSPEYSRFLKLSLLDSNLQGDFQSDTWNFSSVDFKSEPNKPFND